MSGDFIEKALKKVGQHFLEGGEGEEMAFVGPNVPGHPMAVLLEHAVSGEPFTLATKDAVYEGCRVTEVNGQKVESIEDIKRVILEHMVYGNTFAAVTRVPKPLDFDVIHAARKPLMGKNHLGVSMEGKLKGNPGFLPGFDPDMAMTQSAEKIDETTMLEDLKANLRAWPRLPLGGTLFNRVVFPPPPPIKKLEARWEMTFEAAPHSDDEEEN